MSKKVLIVSASPRKGSNSEALALAFADMVKDSKYTDNKELLLIPGARHTDLYDGGGKNAIPFDKLASFFDTYLN